ncbi:putative baseplate assembly protein [Leptolyngbya sp. FACHB-671]|uniref:putative baseplate assembly protein n=1 Tax=Leptolyngbya sp. FACHB-671 TaxID=2692812 RepID=UPI001682A0C2|nr:putative baseplate assembly protein [Leptolyngbya sp. FACHB-671]MBD1867169.1 putative baseplate assembly protein [Cyanobacteria bacterium FACHB-471]MBD2066477.1 putative baseplate assembly protein [Leptolyngbya sp. FACHB-671]
MDFDFLPELPKSDLDDRKFNDLVEECRLRIPRYCPEWTNHNPGDPGMTLVELFAWLTDQMLLRFNQVPRRNYVTFLELLGIRLEPPTAATVELTFELTREQPAPVTISSGTEVATVRTETEEAVIFTTDANLTIGNPQIKHLLTINHNTDTPTETDLRNPFSGTRHEQSRQWQNFESDVYLFDSFNPRPGNCFYLVLTEPTDAIAGNVLAVNFRGQSATGTGIDPDDPPLQWQVWNGDKWCNIDRYRDETKGFSFSAIASQGTNPRQEGADVILHLPQQMVKATFGGYEGYWIRCVYALDPDNEQQSRYSVSPRIAGLSVRAIGGSVNASECVRVERELLGVSNGKPNQVFQLQSNLILEVQNADQIRRPDERIRVKLPGQSLEQAEDWTEVRNFANSGAEDLHYQIDSRTGEVQFGPLVRESAHLKQQTQQRGLMQAWGKLPGQEGNGSTLSLPESTQSVSSERQYGKVPPLGAEIYMMAYRTGGSSRGNVEPQKLTVLKTAIPYVKSVVNYERATGGADPESLSQAVMRVPKQLRTRKAAVTPEDFEYVVEQHPEVGRVRCSRNSADHVGGTVPLLIVPVPSSEHDHSWLNGMNPDRYFTLSEEFCTKIKDYMVDRKPLGVQINPLQPDYLGVKVILEVIPDPKYNTLDILRNQLLTKLYQFLNPLFGGSFDPFTDVIRGWDWGRPVYPAEILALCRTVPGILHLGAVKLFRIEKDNQGWHCQGIPESVIELRESQLVCSWADEMLGSSHAVEFIQ